jgi:tRNA U34 2-thiouridine synthase MnmA/TrmU
VTGLEPAIYGVTGRRDNQLRYTLTIGMMKIQHRIVPIKSNELYEVDAKIRSTQKGKPALIRLNEDNRVEVRFAESQKAVTPGQSVVFYKDESVLGGGVII